MESSNMQIDRQSLNDLEIFKDKGYGQNLFEFLDNTQTNGGKDFLKKIFRNPSSNIKTIRKRQQLIKFIIKHPDIFEQIPSRTIMNRVEVFFYSKAPVSSQTNAFAGWFHGLFLMAVHKEYGQNVKYGLRIIIQFLNSVKAFMDSCSSVDEDLPEMMDQILDDLSGFLEQKRISRYTTFNPNGYYPFGQSVMLDKYFREEEKKSFTKIIERIHELDAYLSMAKSIKEFGLVFPEFTESQTPVIELKNVVHPFIRNAIPNSISFSGNSNIIFLTGPNMGGKTTFMKSMGIAVYLAHTGMGVPASSMKLSISDCIFTSLNTNDNVSLGYSYFYSEVLRVKRAAQLINEHKNCFILLDELFKGTNIKDAFDGNQLVIEGLANWPEHRIILSSHLAELSRNFEEDAPIQYFCFHSSVKDSKPVFDYKLSEGISEEKIGRVIIENEQIPDLLKCRK